MTGNLKAICSLKGHSGIVWNVSWHPKGLMLASCGEDKTIRLWNYKDGDKSSLKCLLADGHQRTVRAIAWSYCGQNIASASFDATVAIWDNKSGQFECNATLEGHENEVKSVAWSKSGSMLATCSRDKSVWVWEVWEDNEYECAAVLNAHSQDVKKVVWHPHEDILASASYDNSVKLYMEDPADKEWTCVGTLSSHTSTVWSVAFDKSGDRIVTSSDDRTLKIWQKYLQAGVVSRRRFHTTDKVRNVPSMAKLSEVVSTLKKMAPLSLAESWDNVGLLIEPNDVQQPVDCVFLTNDLTEDVLDEAESVKANLIVSYHPPVFAPFKRITSDNWKGRIVSRCLGQGIAIYSPHTSWDAVENGLTDWLIRCFDGTVSTIQGINVNPDFSHVVTLSRLVAVDESPLNGKMINAILESHPFFGNTKDFKILSHNEFQLQLLCNSNALSSLNEIAKSHNIYLHANKNELLPSSVAGMGRRCQFKNELSISTVIKKVKHHLGVDNLMVALARGSTLESTVDSAAAVAGSGASALKGVRAGLYLTGEMSHHDVLDAVHNGVTVVLANHSNTERNYLKVFADRLLKEMPRLTVHVSKVDSDPLMFV